jgi:hypothetical protein
MLFSIKDNVDAISTQKATKIVSWSNGSNIITTEKDNSEKFNLMANSIRKNETSTEFTFFSDERIVNYIYTTFIYDDITFESIPKTKYVIENISREIGVEKVDYALLNILSKKIYNSPPETIVKYLALLSSIELEFIPLTSMLSVTSLSSSKYDIVKESVLATVESWEWPGAVPYLENMEEFKRPYLQKYKNEVISYLRNLE